MRETFAIEFARNNGFPVGGALWVPQYHPELRISPPYTEWTFAGDMVRMPEFCAHAALGNKPNVDYDRRRCPGQCERRALQAWRQLGRPHLLCRRRHPVLRVQPFPDPAHQDSALKTKLPAGRVKIEVETAYLELKPAGPLKITMKANGELVAEEHRADQRAAAFHGKRLSRHRYRTRLAGIAHDYFDKMPFKFNGDISTRCTSSTFGSLIWLI